ncbi:MAG: hypothetical protein ACREH8_13615 [Opitutaceae bacterium]
MSVDVFPVVQQGEKRKIADEFAFQNFSDRSVAATPPGALGNDSIERVIRCQNEDTERWSELTSTLGSVPLTFSGLGADVSTSIE